RMNHWTSDTTLLVVLVGLGMLALFLAAMFHAHRRWSLQKRLAAAPFLWAVSTVLVAYLIIANHQKSGWALFAGILFVFWLSQSLVAFFVWRSMSRLSRQAAALGRPQPDSVDPFFRQGLLILLPVALLALVGLASLKQDEQATEREL